MRGNLVKYAALALILATALPLGAAAFNSGNPPPPPQVFQSVSDVWNFIDNIISFLFWIIMMFAVILILWAAFNYLTAQGSPEKVETAQRMLLYAVIAIVIAVLARSIPTIVGDFVQNAASSPGYGP